jgi:hypothetical protein
LDQFQEEQVKETKKPEAKKKEQFACNLSLLYDGDKEIMSLEELRASSTKYAVKPIPKALKSALKKPKNVASPTINTKAAMEDVFEMFNQPISTHVWEDEDETIRFL